MTRSLDETVFSRALNVLIMNGNRATRGKLQQSQDATSLLIDVSDTADAAGAIADQVSYDAVLLNGQVLESSKTTANLTADGGWLINYTQQLAAQSPLVMITDRSNVPFAFDFIRSTSHTDFPAASLPAEAAWQCVRSALRAQQAEEKLAASNRRLQEKIRLLEHKDKVIEQQQQRIRAQDLQLQDVDKLKAEFLATMSHELRTPLNAIIGFSQILMGKTASPLNGEQADMLGRILANGKHLLEMINEILSFSKVSANQVVVEPVNIYLPQLVEQATDQIMPSARAKGLSVEVSVDMSEPLVINDAALLQQVLSKLLSNAVKFTDEGYIYIQVEENSQETVLIHVVDTGCGISNDAQRRIFKTFQQADQKLTRQHSGVGLGLTLAHSLVTLMHGEIRVRSSVDEGSCFTIEIPRDLSTSNHQAASSAGTSKSVQTG